MRSVSVNIGDSILASQYNNLLYDAAGGAFLLPHEQNTPDLTLKVEAGVCYVGATRVIYVGGNSPSFTAPSANPRIDLLTIDSSGTLARTTGTEAASPSVPTYPNDKLVIAEVYCRIGQTTVRDSDQGSNGYIKQDVRPFLGGAYIASNAQVSASAAIQPSKLDAGNVDANWIPDANDSRDLGSGSREWNNLYAKTIYQNGALLSGPKFGGDGSDGALNVTSGTTTVNLSNASYVVLNYSSINISSGATLAFSNPATNGTIVVLRSQGSVTIAGTITANFGSAGGGAGGENTTGNAGNKNDDIFDALSHGGSGGGQRSGSNGGGGGSGGVTLDTTSITPKAMPYTTATTYLYRRTIMMTCGAGGGSGAGGIPGGGVSGGAGGRGGGGLLIECAGALTFTGNINMAGTVGSTGGASSNGNGPSGGGGGGGGGGMLLLLYNTLTSNTGTVTLSGGNGGNAGTPVDQNGSENIGGEGGGGGGMGVAAAGGAGGAGGNASVNGNDGSAGGGSSGGTGGTHSNHGTNGTPPNSGGSGGGGGGGTGVSLITKNIWFG